MLSLFKAKPLVSKEEESWLIDAFIWACDNFDGQYFLEHTQVIEPTGQFFPDQVSSVEQMAQTVFKRVRDYAGLQVWPVQLVNPNQMMPQQIAPFKFVSSNRGADAQIVNPPSIPMSLSYNPNQINQPQDLVASLAGSLALMMVYQKGVMMSNTVYQFKGGCGSCYNPYANRQAALTEPQTVFMHALICHFKPQVDGKKHLKPHLRSMYKQAQKQIKALLNESANPYLLALEEKRHAQLS